MNKKYVNAYEAVLYLMKARDCSWEEADALLRNGINTGKLPTWKTLDDGFLLPQTPEEALKNLDSDKE
jgi:hypothetical protein